MTKVNSPKYIFIVGGVLSGLGKGIAASSIAKLIQGKGFEATAMKIDPYVNVDAGTMNPTEHGEVFVTKDGMETDQDIGNYERFLGRELTRENYMTTGQVYLSVIKRERNLEYAGKCVEVVPHIPEEVIRRIKLVAKKSKSEVVVVEIGGTVGEYQNLIFLEAARMMHLKNPGSVQFVLVSYLPIPNKLGEMKTKPTQYAVRTLNSAGVQPDFILCRSERPLDRPRKEKLSIFCNMRPEDIISAPDADSVYQVPLNLEKEKLTERLLLNFGLRAKKNNLKDWQKLVNKIKTAKKTVRIGMVGKYFETGKFTLMDSYLSVIEAIKHAAWHHGRRLEIRWIEAEDFEKDKRNLARLKEVDGLIIPGGFGSRGVAGKILAIEYARMNKLPFLGLCYGMQLAVVEFCQHVLKIKDAHSTEINLATKNPVIDLMLEQKKNLASSLYGGTMRLGEYPCCLISGTKAAKSYGERQVMERHRHRYEFNNRYQNQIEKAGLKISGINPQRKLVEIVELTNHPFFVGVQFHPEFKSYPLEPHPLFRDFIKACLWGLEKK